MNLLIIAGGVVIAALAVIALYYHWRLRQQSQRQQQYQASLESGQQQNRRSILILAQAMLANQVSYTEASIRISVLLEGTGLAEAEIAKFSVFQQLAQATSHIPILAEWKALPKQQKKKYDNERERLESQYRDFLIPAAQQLIEQLDG